MKTKSVHGQYTVQLFTKDYSLSFNISTTITVIIIILTESVESAKAMPLKISVESVLPMIYIF